ncbi:MAG: LodA/GoxA family CTQ-dependent oxidase, partial [Gemmatimonadales bacterium]
MALPPKPPRYAIYPGVGIARVGDSPEYYVHPDEPTLDLYPVPFKLPFTPVSDNLHQFRDTSKRIRRQGARFRVYEVKWKKYRNKTWIPADPVKLIKAGGGVELRWKVSVCNAKHFTALTASGAPPALATRTRLEASADISSKPPRAHKDLKVVKGPGRPKDILLGAVTVDGDGNLILVGGEGQCFSDGEPLILGDGALFQAKWFDDVCDGRVECEVFEGGVSTGKALPAW